MNIDEIIEAVLSAKKYRGIDRSVVERTSVRNVQKLNKPKDVIKAVKKELHIIHESFIPENSHAAAMDLLNKYEDTTEFALKVMALHASTRERLKQADEIYNYISGLIKPSDTIADIGCGYNPLSLPFFKIKPKNYLALDIGLPMIGLLNHYFDIINSTYQSRIFDAMNETVDADVLFMFKLFPLLERQKKGRGFEILQQSSYRVALVSFPLKSATGKEKGMKAFYSNLFENGIGDELTILNKIEFKNEMFYEVKRDRR